MKLRNYIKEKDYNLGIKLEATWLKASEFHNRQTRPGENNNGISHCEKVDDNIYRFLMETSNNKTKLTPNVERFALYELYILSCAACLHDIDKATMPVTLEGDFRHGEGSAKFVLDHWEKLNIIDLTHTKYIAKVMSLHDLKDDFYEKMKLTAHLHGEINLRCLATLFKAADTLHFDDSRISHLAVPTDSLDGFAYKKQVVRSSILSWGFNGERIEVDYSIDQQADMQIFLEFEDYFFKSEWPPVEKGLAEFQFPYLISFNNVSDGLNSIENSKLIVNNTLNNTHPKAKDNKTIRDPKSENITSAINSSWKVNNEDVYSVINEIRERVPKLILNNQKQNLTIFRIGSNSQLHHGAEIRHKVCDIDYLIISRKKIEIALIRSIKRKLELICKEYSNDDIIIEFQLVNGAIKPESKSNKITILIHILLHEENAFLKTQPKIFLFSWYNAMDSKDRNELKEFISPVYDGTPPKISHVLYEDYGIINLLDRIRNLDSFFEFYSWDDRHKGEGSLLRKLKRQLGRYEKIDFIHYAILWSVCNVMRAIEGKSNLSVEKEVTIDSFVKHFGKSLNTGHIKFLKSIHYQRYNTSLAYKDISDSREMELLNDAKCFLSDLINILDLNEKNKIELHLNSLNKIFENDYKYLNNNLSIFTQILNDQNNNIVSEVLLSPIFGCDLDKTSRNALIVFLKSTSSFSQIFKKVIWRRLYYYLERARVFSLLRKPGRYTKLIDQSSINIMNNLQMNLERYVSDFTNKAKIANSIRDLASLSETLTDEKIFTICRILSIKEQYQLVYPSELINFLISEVSATMDDFIDDSNLWWATYFLITIKDSVGDYKTNELITSIVLKAFQKGQSGLRFPIPENTDKNITSEIHGEFRTRLYILVNILRILDYLFLRPSDFLPSKDYLIEILNIHLGWIAEQETNNFYLITLRIEVLVRYFSLIEKYHQKQISNSN